MSVLHTQQIDQIVIADSFPVAYDSEVPRNKSRPDGHETYMKSAVNARTILRKLKDRIA